LLISPSSSAESEIPSFAMPSVNKIMLSSNVRLYYNSK